MCGLPCPKQGNYKKKYLIPLAAKLFDRLAKARYFKKLILRSCYWKVRIAEGDEAKTTCVTRYGSYEFLVMPFGLTNAPATFCNLMNDVLFNYLNAFVVVYLDDIVVYSQALSEHEMHLKKVFQWLREHKLYVKPESTSLQESRSHSWVTRSVKVIFEWVKERCKL